MNEVLKAIQKRRSIRRFTSEPLTREQLEAILEAGRWAPSGKNTQPWRFVVVETRNKREELAKLVSQGGMVAAAPVTLAVHSFGLGACWVGKTRDAAIERIVEAREHEELMALIPIGHPAESPAPPSRHPLREITRFI